MTKIDSNIVKLSFDNKDFEAGARTSMSTLSELNKNLNFSGAIAGVNNLNTATAGMKNLALPLINDTLDNIGTKISALSIIAITALANITTKAVDAGFAIVKSLTLDPITEGFAEYELKMGAIQTIMAGTGRSMDDVNAALAELNEYSDLTIYSFKDMTSNIGKFTNAGVSLEEAVGAIKGVANVAALSGANANDASRAMYNFGQALGSGVVRLIDWKSIETANMSTKEFKDQLIDAAVAAGTLTKSNDGLVTSLEGTEVNFKNMQYTLDDQWLTSEVLVKVLNDYANAETEIGKKATQAATEVKSLTQLLGTMQESVGSSWATTWEWIVGNKEQSTKLLTGINDAFSDIIEPISDAAHATLEYWNQYGGRMAIISGLARGFENLKSIIGAITEAFREFFPPITGRMLEDISIKFHTLMINLTPSEKIINNIKRTFSGFFAVLEIGVSIFSGVIKVLTPIVSKIFGMGDGVLSVTAIFGDWLVKLNELFHAGGKFDAFVQTIVDFLSQPFPFTFDDVVAKFKEFGSVIASVYTDKVVPALAKFAPVFQEVKEAFIAFIETLKIFYAYVKEKIIVLFTDLEAEVTEFGSSFEAKLTPIIDKLIVTFGKIKDSFSEILEIGKQAVTDGKMDFEKFFEGIKNSTGPVGEAIAWIIEKFEALKSIGGIAIEKAKEVFSTISDYVSSSIQAIKDGFAPDNVGGDEAETIFAILNAGLIGTIIAGIALFIKNLSDALAGAKDIVEGAVGILNEIQNTLQAFQDSIKADIIMKIATAVVMLVGAVVVLSLLDPGKVTVGVMAIGALLGELFGSFYLFQKTTKDNPFDSITKICAALIEMSVAVLILANAVKVVGEMRLEDILQGLFAITTIIAELIATTMLLQKASSSMKEASGALIAFSFAVGILAIIVWRLGVMDTGVIVQGLIGITVLIGEVCAMAAILGNSKKTLAESAAGLIAFAAAVAILAVVVVQLGSQTDDVAWTGLAILSLLLLEIAAFAVIVSNFSKSTFLDVAAGLLLLSVGMVALAGAVMMLGSLPVEQLIAGVAAIAGILLTLGTFVFAIGQIKTGDVITACAALTILSVAVAVLTDSIVKLSALSSDDMFEALKSILAVVGVMVAALGILAQLDSAKLMTAAAALLVVSVAIGLLVPPLMLLGTIGLVPLALAIAGLAAVFAVLILAAYLLQPVIIVFVAFAGALTLIGLAIFLAGTGVLQFALALASLAAVAAVGIENVEKMLIMLLNLIPLAAQRLAEGIVQFIVSLFTYGGPAMIAAFTEFILALLQVGIDVLPKLYELGVAWINAILDAIVELVPKIIDTGWTVLMSFLEGIEANIYKLTDTALGIMTEFINGIADNLGDVIQAGFNMIVSFIEGITDCVGDKENQKRIKDAVVDMFVTVVEAILPDFLDGGKKATDEGFIQGVKDNWENIKKAFKDFIDKGIAAIKDKYEDIKDGALALIDKFITSIKDSYEDFKTAIKDFIDEGIDKIEELAEDFYDMGADLIQGFIDGIISLKDKIVETVSGIGKKVLSAFKISLDESSPSKATEAMGEYFDQGFINGLKNLLSPTAEAAKNVGETAISTLQKAIGDVSELVNTNIDTSPTIKPVLDLTNIQEGSKQIGTLMAKEQMLSASASLDKANYASTLWRAGLEQNQNGSENAKSASKAITVTNNFYSPKALSEYDVAQNTLREGQRLQLALTSV